MSYDNGAKPHCFSKKDISRDQGMCYYLHTKAVGWTFVEAPSLYGSNGFGPNVLLFVRALFPDSDCPS